MIKIVFRNKSVSISRAPIRYDVRYCGYKNSLD